MNIKRAKQEIKNTIQVYLTKNEHGEHDHTPYETECHRSPVYLGEDLQWEECPCDGIYHE